MKRPLRRRRRMLPYRDDSYTPKERPIKKVKIENSKQTMPTITFLPCRALPQFSENECVTQLFMKKAKYNSFRYNIRNNEPKKEVVALEKKAFEFIRLKKGCSMPPTFQPFLHVIIVYPYLRFLNNQYKNLNANYIDRLCVRWRTAFIAEYTIEGKRSYQKHYIFYNFDNYTGTPIARENFTGAGHKREERILRKVTVKKPMKYTYSDSFSYYFDPYDCRVDL